MHWMYVYEYYGSFPATFSRAYNEVLWFFEGHDIQLLNFHLSILGENDGLIYESDIAFGPLNCCLWLDLYRQWN